MKYKEIKVIKNNPSLQGMALMIPDVIFSTLQGVELKMQILKPWIDEQLKESPAYPLIVFVQGSSWTCPNVYYEIPQLAAFARSGYVVATLTHRNCLEGHPFPAFLEDIKTGIRFLRKNASTYNIDPEKVAIWGTSSGGNASLLVGLTGDECCYKTAEYADCSDAVALVIDCFGPTDLTLLVQRLGHLGPGFQSIFEGLRGEDTKENLKKLLNISPIHHIKADKKYPPFLILQGDADTTVNYAQSELMFHRLSDVGADATLVRVEGAPHEGSFWCNEIFDFIKEFIDRNLK